VSRGPADSAAVAWIHQALEDIAATALGLEIASRELFLRAGMAEDQTLKVEATQEQSAE
jgi:pyruvate/2-oxoacid:ferredoxin oxidoreductase beta subunit